MATSKKTKPASAARTTAMNAVKNAKSDQEKRVAAQTLRAVKFKEVAPNRVSRALSALENVAKVANRKAYAWETAHAEKILTALDASVKKIRDALTSTTTDSKTGGFTL